MHPTFGLEPLENCCKLWRVTMWKAANTATLCSHAHTLEHFGASS